MEFIDGYREANKPQRPAEKAKPLAPDRAVDRAITHTESSRIAAPGATVTSTATVTERVEEGDTAYQTTQSATLSVALDSVNDAPPCDVCGTITVRSGTCYKCLNCGNSMGCS